MHSIDFKVNGGKTLAGEITTNTSKNGAMGLLCASLLNKGTTTLHGIPRIEEVNRILEVLHSIGVKYEWLSKNTLKIQPPKEFKLDEIDVEAATRTRTIIMFIGSLIHEFKKFKLPHSQGCKLGKRTIAAHQFGLESMGVKIEVHADHYLVTSKELKESEIIMFEAGDTATENLLIAASKIPGKTTIKYASSNYMVQDVCCFLEALGVKIEGVGTSTIIVHGKENIDQDIEFYNSEDPIEAMMLFSAAIVTNSEITINRVPIEFVELELYRLAKMGFAYQQSTVYKSKNNHTKLVDITTKKSELKAIDEKITCGAYPDINIDNLPFFVPIAAASEGVSLIHDWVYENRSFYFLELTKLGIDIRLADPHRVFVYGKNKFKPAQVVCPPALRPAMIVLIAMLGASGTSILRNVYSINRGYEEIAERLNQIGADIEVLNG